MFIQSRRGCQVRTLEKPPAGPSYGLSTGFRPDRHSSRQDGNTCSTTGSALLKQPKSKKPLVLRSLADGGQHVRRLGQDGFLEVRSVCNGYIERTDPPDRRVEMPEQLAGDARGDFRAESARQLILVRDDDAARALDQR